MDFTIKWKLGYRFDSLDGCPYCTLKPTHFPQRLTARRRHKFGFTDIGYRWSRLRKTDNTPSVHIWVLQKVLQLQAQ